VKGTPHYGKAASPLLKADLPNVGAVHGLQAIRFNARREPRQRQENRAADLLRQESIDAALQ